MKKIAFTLLILTVFLGCVKTDDKKVEKNIEINVQGVMSKDLEDKHGLLFEKGKETPYTGIALEKFPSGKIRGVINYSGGKRNGEETYYYETGELSAKTNFENGKPQGQSLTFQKVTHEYVEGVLNGMRLIYHTNGLIQRETMFENRVSVGEEKVYHSNGNISQINQYVNGKLEGIQEIYHWNGYLQYRIPHINGKREGILEEYNPKGEIIRTEVWENGQIKK